VGGKSELKYLKKRRGFRVIGHGFRFTRKAKEFRGGGGIKERQTRMGNPDNVRQNII